MLKKLAVVLILAFLSLGQFAPCQGYEFRVLPNGAHQVRNVSAASYPAQVGRVFHNGEFVGALNFPGLAPETLDWQGAWFAGSLPVVGSWHIQGQVCSGSGMVE